MIDVCVDYTSLIDPDRYPNTKNSLSAPNSADPMPFEPVLPRAHSLSTSSNAAAPLPPMPYTARRSTAGTNVTTGALLLRVELSEGGGLICQHPSSVHHYSDGGDPGPAFGLPPDVFGGGTYVPVGWLAGWLTCFKGIIRV